MSVSPSPVDATALSLFQLLDPAVHADPYPLYARLRAEAPVHWDPFMNTWVVSRYADVLTVLHTFKADRTPSLAQLDAIGMSAMGPIAEMMRKQILFMDPPGHASLRKFCSTGFTPRRVEAMEVAVQRIADELIDKVIASGEIDIVADFADPFPAIVTASLLGVPTEDHVQLKAWSADFGELLGNFQHNLERLGVMLAGVAEMVDYFRAAIARLRVKPVDGLILSLMNAETDGERLGEEEIIANLIIIMVAGLETTTNLIGTGVLILLQRPDDLAWLRADPQRMKPAVEELMRFDSPSQHSARIAPGDVAIGGVTIPKGAPVMALIASANRDSAQFVDADRLDLARSENRHLAFGWGGHFCIGAPLSRLEGRIAFSSLFGRLESATLATDTFEWRSNLGLRGLKALPVQFKAAA